MRPKAKEQQGARTDISQISSESLKPIDTRIEVAASVGISHDILFKVKKIAERKPDLIVEIEEPYDKFKAVLPARVNLSNVMADLIDMFVAACKKYGDEFILDVMCNRGKFEIKPKNR